MTVPTAAPPIQCPRCQLDWLDVATAATDGWITCPLCAHRASSGYLIDLASLDAYVASLAHHRTWLLERIAAGDPHARPTFGASPGNPGVPASAHGRHVSAAGVQRFLLTGGGILLGLAGLFFAAVTWQMLGPGGRLMVLLLTSLAFGVGGHVARQRVRAAADTLASISAAFLAIALYAAKPLGVISTTIPFDAWAIAVAALLTCLYLACATVTRMRVWVAAAVLSGIVAVLTGAVVVALRTDEPLWFTGITGAAALAVIFLPRMAAVRHVVTVVCGRVGADLSPAFPAVRPAIVLYGATAASLLCWFATPERTSPYAVAFTAFGLATITIRTTVPSRATSRALDIVAGGALGAAAAFFIAALSGAHSAPSLAAATGAALLLVAVSVDDRIPTFPSLAAAGVLGAGGVIVPGLLAAPSTTGHVVAFSLLAGVGLFTAAGIGRTGRVRWSLLAWPAAAMTSIAWLAEANTLAFGSGEFALEVFLFPIAVSLMVAGAIWGTRSPQDSGSVPRSVPVALPALLVFIVPGSLKTLDLTYGQTDTGTLIRSAVFLIGGAALIALGARLRLAAPVTAGTVAVVLATLGHLNALGHALPGWVSLLAAGSILLAVGTRWEWLRAHREDTRTWVGDLR